MNFDPNDEQRELQELARSVLARFTTPAGWAAVESDPDRQPVAAWAALAEAGLLGVPLAEGHGGVGLGLVEAALVLEEIGRSALPLPFLHSVVICAGAIEHFGSEAQASEWLPRVVRGEALLAAALDEEGCPLPPAVPLATRLEPDGPDFRLTGRKLHVPHAAVSTRLVVPARLPDGRAGVVVVDSNARGVGLVRQQVTTFDPRFVVEFDGVRVSRDDLLGEADQGEAILGFMLDRAWMGLAALQAGVSDEALRLTARHVSEREQFGQKVGTFQAVAQRAADAWIDVQAIRLTARQAAWRLEQRLDAADELAIARFWACEAGQRVAHTAQHLHGGLGVLTDYPLHRLFRLARQLELSLGGAGLQLERLGAAIADGPRAGRVD